MQVRERRALTQPGAEHGVRLLLERQDMEQVSLVCSDCT